MKSLFIGQLFNEKFALIFKQAKANPPIREGGAALAAENEFICALGESRLYEFADTFHAFSARSSFLPLLLQPYLHDEPVGQQLCQ